MNSRESILISGELSDVNVFFVAFEEMQKELKKLNVPTAIANVGKDELGWYVNIRIRPSDKY